MSPFLKRNCGVSPLSAAWNGTRCRRTSAKISLTISSFTPDQTLDTVADLLTFLQIVPITGKLKALLADPDDDKVLECASTVGATHIVTGDRQHLLPLGTFQGIPIVTAAEFLALATAP
jgi:predicted nucleic acid-binding protein